MQEKGAGNMPVCRRAAYGAALAVALVCGCATLSGPRAGAVHHVVVCWLKKPGDAADRQRLLAASRALAAIPGVAAVRAGRVLPSSRKVVDSTYDVAVVISFADEAALKTYLAHPEHQKATEEVLVPLTQRVIVYDFVE